MGIIFLIVGGIALFILLRFFIDRAKGFPDPKPMSNLLLVSSIAGQADCLERISAAPFETQNSPSIADIAKKRRDYMARLCLEVLSRDSVSEDQIKYPGVTRELDRFSEAAQYAKELEATGVSRENAAVRAVKEKLFVANGVIYPSRWEV